VSRDVQQEYADAEKRQQNKIITVLRAVGFIILFNFSVAIFFLRFFFCVL